MLASGWPDIRLTEATGNSRTQRPWFLHMGLHLTKFDAPNPFPVNLLKRFAACSRRCISGRVNLAKTPFYLHIS